MKLEWARLTPFRLALRRAVSTARGEIRAREGWLLQLGAGGRVGCGAASPLAGFGLESSARCGEALREIARGWLAAPECDLEARLAALEAAFDAAPAARGAADTALHDLAARSAGLSLAAWLAGGGPVRASIELGALLLGDSAGRLAARAAEAEAAGYGTLKLKVAGRDLSEDQARLAEVRRVLRPATKIRLDANEGYAERETALHALECFARHGVELIEQPLPAAALDDAAWLVERSPIPVAADEAAIDERASRAVVDAGAAHILVVKPSACGGLAPARKIAAVAREAGLGCFVTSLLDSSVGVVAAAHLAASLAGPMPACGLATGDLIAEDLLAMPAAEGGRLSLPEGVGSGCEVEPARLKRLATGPVCELRA